MKELRLTLYLLLGLFLGAVSALSFAETIDATYNASGSTYPRPVKGWGANGNGDAIGFSSTYQEAAGKWCKLYSADSVPGTYYPAYGSYDYQVSFNCVPVGGSAVYKFYDGCGNDVILDSTTCSRTAATYTCPSSEWQLQGNKCYKPTVCPSGYHLHIPDDGQCEKDCSGRQVQKPDGKCGCNQESGMLAVPWSALNEKCVGGCTVSGSAAIGNPLDIAKYMAGAATVQQVTAYGYFQFNGQTCAEPSVKIPANVQFIPKDNTATAADNTTPDPKNTPKNNENPDACGAAGGSFAVVNGVGKCLSSAGNTMDAPKKLSVQEKSTTVTNPDGSKTEQKEQEFRVYDPKTGGFSSEKSTTTIQKDASGNVIGTTGGTGTASGTGDSGEGQCAKEPNSPLCRQGAVKDKGNYGNGQDAQIEAAKNELRQKFAEVKAQASAMFSGNLTGGAGSLPCYAPITVLGQQLSMCFTKYESSLGVIGGFVMLMAALCAAFIILRR